MGHRLASTSVHKQHYAGRLFHCEMTYFLNKVDNPDCTMQVPRLLGSSQAAERKWQVEEKDGVTWRCECPAASVKLLSWNRGSSSKLPNKVWTRPSPPMRRQEASFSLDSLSFDLRCFWSHVYSKVSGFKGRSCHSLAEHTVITSFFREHQPGRPLRRNRSTSKSLKPSAKRWSVCRLGVHVAGNHVIAWSWQI